MLGRYRLLRLLARGGMSTVWVAEDHKLSRSVAVKLLSTDLVQDPELRRRFEREAMAVARLQSPHIVQIFDYSIHEDCPAIVMELLHGEDLRRRLKRQRKIPLPKVFEIVRQVARGLGEAHAAGVIHRDLKPSNIFFARGRQHEVMKILDFGVAKADGAFSTGETTSAGQILGTPHFMSPEQAKAKGAVDHRTDLWSMGVLVYNMLTGQLPFTGHSPTQVLLAVASEPYHPVTLYNPELPPSLDGFIDRALARDPDHRFSSAAELANALGAIVQPRGSGAAVATTDGAGDDEDEIETVLDTGTQDLPAQALVSRPGVAGPASRPDPYTGGIPGTVQLPAEMLEGPLTSPVPGTFETSAVPADELPSHPSMPSFPSHPSEPSSPSHGSLGNVMLSAAPPERNDPSMRRVMAWAALAVALGFVSVVGAIAMLQEDGDVPNVGPAATAPATTTSPSPTPAPEEPESPETPEEPEEADAPPAESAAPEDDQATADEGEGGAATAPEPSATAAATKPAPVPKAYPQPYPKPTYKPVPKPTPKPKADPYGSRF